MGTIGVPVSGHVPAAFGTWTQEQVESKAQSAKMQTDWREQENHWQEENATSHRRSQKGMILSHDG